LLLRLLLHLLLLLILVLQAAKTITLLQITLRLLPLIIPQFVVERPIIPTGLGFLTATV
jgi:hypothetical protein